MIPCVQCTGGGIPFFWCSRQTKLLRLPFSLTPRLERGWKKKKKRGKAEIGRGGEGNRKGRKLLDCSPNRRHGNDKEEGGDKREREKGVFSPTAPLF